MTSVVVKTEAVAAVLAAVPHVPAMEQLAAMTNQSDGNSHKAAI